MIKKLRNNKFAWNSLILFTGTMIVNVLNYVFHLVMGRMVTIEVYGEIESLISLTHIMSVPALTLTIIATKYSAENKVDNNPAGSRSILRFMNKKVFVYGAPLFLIALFITPLIKEFLKIDNGLAIFFIWVLMFIAFFSSINSGILTGWQKFKDISIVGIISTAIKLISAVVFIKIGFALSGVIGAFLLSAIAIYVGTIFVLKFIFVGEKEESDDNKKQKPVDFSSMKRYVLPVAITPVAKKIAFDIMFNAPYCPDIVGSS